MRTIVGILAAATLGCFTLVAPAGAGAAHTHDGLFLRLSAGGGIAGTRIGVGDPSQSGGVHSVEVEGRAADFDVAIGAMVRKDVALHVTAFGWSTHDPDVDVISRFGMFAGTLYGRETVGAVGPGFTWYIAPTNLYLTGSAGVARLRFSGDLDGKSRTGFAMTLGLGREWWVRNSWGVGIAGGYTYHTVPDESLKDDWAGGSYTLRVSATVN